MSINTYAAICTIADVLFLGAAILATYGVTSAIADAVRWLRSY